MFEWIWDTYVLASASKISCASFVTPFPLVASLSLIFLIAAASLAFTPLRSIAVTGGRESSPTLLAGVEMTVRD